MTTLSRTAANLHRIARRYTYSKDFGVIEFFIIIMNIHVEKHYLFIFAQSFDVAVQ